MEIEWAGNKTLTVNIKYNINVNITLSPDVPDPQRWRHGNTIQKRGQILPPSGTTALVHNGREGERAHGKLSAKFLNVSLPTPRNVTLVANNE